MILNLQQRLSKLKLAGMRNTLEVRLKQAEGEAMPYTEFLALLIEDEMTNREDNRRKKLYRKAHIPSAKGMEDFDFSFQPSIKKRELLDLATGNFLTTATNILFTGQPGTGKTHLATSLGLRALALNKTILFTTLWDMLDTLNQSRADLSFQKKIQMYVTPDLLIIDELGYKPLSPQAVQDLFEIVAKRYEKKAIIITSNRSISEWDKIFLDKTLTTALLDRLLHHCHVIEIKGESYRMRNKQATA